MTEVKISSLNVVYQFDVDGNAEATLENLNMSICIQPSRAREAININPTAAKKKKNIIPGNQNSSPVAKLVKEEVY